MAGSLKNSAPAQRDARPPVRGPPPDPVAIVVAVSVADRIERRAGWSSRRKVNPARGLRGIVINAKKTGARRSAW